MKLPKDINADNSIPFVGKLGSQKREVMLAAFIKAAQVKNVWEKIRPAQVMDILPNYTAYKLNPQGCWNEFHEMRKEGLIIVGKDNDGAFVEVTEQVINLVTSNS